MCILPLYYSLVTTRESQRVLMIPFNEGHDKMSYWSLAISWANSGVQEFAPCMRMALIYLLIIKEFSLSPLIRMKNGDSILSEN
ncbi:MAG: hypothetical protein A2091_03645 [Desulfuromonadales bacterium GWD2_61_12]|nr:MAG: hypothetical protein A2005_06545 [Desulfuromonadales bacterium GWC2_61_20]OGR35903.1 MAG: hypothetical protein A2091_03645 [Desulfuromonadales bacterium GWD2_61_12]